MEGTHYDDDDNNYIVRRRLSLWSLVICRDVAIVGVWWGRQALAPPSLPSHHRRRCGCCCRWRASLPSEFVARSEGTVGVPCSPRRGVEPAGPRLVAVASRRHFVVAGLVGVCHGGCGRSNEGCGRWWWLVAVVTKWWSWLRLLCVATSHP
jgi:hypothetical protein